MHYSNVTADEGRGRGGETISNPFLHYSPDFLNLFRLTHYCKEDKAGEANALFSAARVFIERPVPPGMRERHVSNYQTHFASLMTPSHWYTGSPRGFWLLVRRCDMQATPSRFLSSQNYIGQLSLGIIVLNALLQYSNKSTESAETYKLPNAPLLEDQPRRACWST